MMDSGAARSVCPVHLCKENGTLPVGSGPEYFRTATGDRIPNHGQRQIRGYTDSGQVMSLRYNVADVSTPLDAVSSICDKGNIVIFTALGGFICGKHGRMTFERKGDTYVRKTWVKRPGARSRARSAAMDLDFLRQDGTP